MWKIFVICVNFFSMHFIACEIFSKMWNNSVMNVNFKFHMYNRCYAYVKFFTCMWTLLGMSEWACEFLFQGLLNATTMNHIFMKMPWISSEYPMKGIAWPMKTAKLYFMPLFLAMNFLWKVLLGLIGHWQSEKHTTSSIMLDVVCFLWFMADTYQTKLTMRVMNFWRKSY